MATENIVKGLAYRIKAAAEGVWDKCSFWTSSDDVFYADNNSAEYKTGAINGITDALDSEDSSIAASSVAVKTLNDSLTADNAQAFQFAYDSESGKYGYKVKEADTEVFVPFNSGSIPSEILYSDYDAKTATASSGAQTVNLTYTATKSCVVYASSVAVKNLNGTSSATITTDGKEVGVISNTQGLITYLHKIIGLEDGQTVTVNAKVNALAYSYVTGSILAMT